MKFRAIELKDLNEDIVGKWIKDKNHDISVKVVDYYEDCNYPTYNVRWENNIKYLDYGYFTDMDTLLRDFDIEEVGE